MARTLSHPTAFLDDLRDRYPKDDSGESFIPSEQYSNCILSLSPEQYDSFRKWLIDESKTSKKMSSENEALTRIFSDLKSKNKDIRLKASYSLLNQVVAAHSGK